MHPINPTVMLLVFLLDFIVGPIIVIAFLMMMTIAAMKARGSIAKKAFIILLVYVLFTVGINIFAQYLAESDNYRNRKPDDSISLAIYEALEGTKVYYDEKVTTSEGILNYSYVFYEENEEQLGKLLEAANAVIQQEEINIKIEITCSIAIYNCGSEPVLSLNNYSDAKQENAEYPSLQKLWIKGSSIRSTTIYNTPETYQNLQGIKYIEIYGDMAKITTKNKIDWYEYLPDLETLEIIPEETHN